MKFYEPQAVGFYEHMGFRAYKRTDFDEEGNPLSPALHEARARRTLTLLRQRGSAAALHELSQTIGAH